MITSSQNRSPKHLRRKNMKFHVPLPDGRSICIQFVVRKSYNRYGEEKKTIYIRGCADTFYHPTPAQQSVRNAVARGASRSFNHSSEYLEAMVKAQFKDWVHRSPDNRDSIEKYLREIFPDDIEGVKQYLEAI